MRVRGAVGPSDLLPGAAKHAELTLDQAIDLLDEYESLAQALVCILWNDGVDPVSALRAAFLMVDGSEAG